MDARTLVEAMTLWEGTGTAVAQAAHAVSGLLTDHGIANLIAGGLAVQLHGDPRTTVDVDIVVRDVEEAHAFLVANGYKTGGAGAVLGSQRVRSCVERDGDSDSLSSSWLLRAEDGSRSEEKRLAVIDESRRVRIDLLPSGKCLTGKCEVPFPDLPILRAIMQPVDLETLISLKLDSWKHSPARRMQDRVDVAELIMRNELPRELKVHPAITEDYRALWDALAAEPPGGHLREFGPRLWRSPAAA